jgi:hypothetical protein
MSVNVYEKFLGNTSDVQSESTGASSRLRLTCITCVD